MRWEHGGLCAHILAAFREGYVAVDFAVHVDPLFVKKGALRSPIWMKAATGDPIVISERACYDNIHRVAAARVNADVAKWWDECDAEEQASAGVLDEAVLARTVAEVSGQLRRAAPVTITTVGASEDPALLTHELVELARALEKGIKPNAPRSAITELQAVVASSRALLLSCATNVGLVSMGTNKRVTSRARSTGE